MENKSADWDPRSEAVLKDQMATYDDMRRRCPVATSRYGYTSLFRHADVMHVLMDHETYSNAVSRFPSVPNGMDPPEHTAYRRLIEPYFEPQQMEAFAPVCREVAVRLVQALPEQADVELMADFAQIFALQIQCAWLGWPVELHEPLRLWTLKNQAATLARDEAAMSAVALEFDGYIKDLLTARRNAGSAAPDDVTTRLLRDQALGRPLTDDEIVSILRNWTVGELGTIAASIGILVHYLAAHAALQQQLREQPALLPAAIDEILRIHAPLVMNRRVTTREVTLGERTLAAGTRLALIWASANRDEAVFGDSEEFRLDREPQLNLLYGAGIHLCPGAPLARLELHVVMEELLGRTRRIALLADQQPVKAFFPASGFSSLPLHIEKAANATPHG
ncbi:cytochrome P450 [Stutzerimonas stutzeri]|uniref:cytochrome P450 n=1 Tax=Stutzerimonas stutzeri TaxID=316 RepID=UPI002208423C|nr:cytochrome P450 [Stutzerimonas stutzeri]UVO16675.1 cytochrome P450 [Stutzerimonas stutzeri]